MASSLHSDKYRIFRDMLVQARLASGLTQVEIAEKLAKPQSYVSKYERGERRLDFAEFMDLAEIMGIDVAQFIEKYCASLKQNTNYQPF